MKTKFKPKASSEKLLLVSAPWALDSRPSIQIGTLKVFLRKKFPDLKDDDLVKSLNSTIDGTLSHLKPV